MAIDQNTEVQAKLATLRARFLERAQDDLAELGAFAEAAPDGAVTPAMLVDCYQRLHRLAGSAGTFGLPELGAAARILEKQLKDQAEVFQNDGDQQHPSVKLPSDLAERVESLVVLIRAGAVQGSGEAAPSVVEKDASPEPSHGMNVTVVLVETGDSRVEELGAELLRYGFVIRAARLQELPDVIAAASGATAVVCRDSALEQVMLARQRVVGEANPRRFPVLCVADDLSFRNRYQAAELGALAFVPEPVNVSELAERIESLAVERSAGVQGRVVIVEDDTELAEHYGIVLSAAGITTQVVTDPFELMQTLASFDPDLVLMDVQMGRQSGVTLARMIRFEPRWLSLPIIYLSSEDNRDNQLEALSKGADEFLTKPVSDDYLVRAIRIRCHRARQLSELMNRDSLTGLLKHSLIKQEVEKELARCRRDGQPASVAMLDLDHFKKVNDNYGHRAGDAVIRALANMLRNRLRDTDRIGRYGGEEFLVVMPGCGSQEAARVLSAITDTFAELVFTAADQTFQVTVSGGIASINEFATGDDAIEAADSALYRRKRAGRNGMTLFTPEPNGGDRS